MSKRVNDGLPIGFGLIAYPKDKKIWFQGLLSAPCHLKRTPSYPANRWLT